MAPTVIEGIEGAKALVGSELGVSSWYEVTQEKINAFAEAHIAPTSRRDAERVVNGIQTRVKLRQQRLPQVDAWLKQQGV